MNYIAKRLADPRQAGVSLIELMVAIAIGSVLMLGLTYTFKNSADSSRELERVGKMIENGRYSISLLTDNLHHAGFYGYFYSTGDPLSTLPDPCEIGNLSEIRNAFSMPLQGFAAPDFTTRADVTGDTTCDNKNLIINSNLSPGSDILVLRRASTEVFTGNPVQDDVYVQANSRQANLLLGNSLADVPNDAADGSTQSMKMYPFSTTNTTPAETRKYHVHVYFVAPCSFGSGANGICTNADDAVPTLKRLELNSDGTNTQMEIVPLVEGVEYMKVRYGIDTSPNSVNAVTNFTGDGSPDSYVASPTTAQWPLVVAVQIDLLLRAPDSTPEYTDTKQYTVAGSTLGPFNDSFKRRVYSAMVRPKNLAGRREIP
ncbi:MAG: PilW family protein [Gammaproteobacteria bacterium]